MNRIKQLREELGYTQQELADKLGGAKSSVASYENESRKPSMEVLLKLSDIFEVSSDYILGVSNVKNLEYEAYKKGAEARSNQEKYGGNLMIGMSVEDETLLTEEDREDIRRFAQFVVDKRKGDK